MLAQTVSASSSTSPALLIGANLIWLAVVVGLIIVFIRRRRRRRTTLDPDFQGAPIAQGVVTALKYQYRKVNNRWLYRITYRVYTQQGQQFFGWEEKYLTRLIEKPDFDVGTHHLVAYRPGWEQVRALPPRRL